MSSRGTPIRTFRCAEELWDDLQECIARRNMWSREQPWSASDFIGLAIKEKIAKMGRSRRAVVEAADRLPDDQAGK